MIKIDGNREVEPQMSTVVTDEMRTSSQEIVNRLKKVGWKDERIEAVLPLIEEINQLKKEMNAIILAHSYVTPDIVYGIADFRGDSYQLAKKARESDADVIIFAGVKFMAETAKIVNPDKTVILPSLEAGCSLADSITAEDVMKLKEQFPDVPVVTYINTNADVKAVSDVVCTSSNALKIVEKLDSDTIIFIPDIHFARNIQKQTKKRIISWNGKCIVHDEFNVETLKELKQQYPDIKILAHPECDPSVAALADFVGSTSQMYEYVKSTNFPRYMIATECGIWDRLRADTDKELLGSCFMCPFMKKNTLELILEALIDPKPENIIEVPEETRVGALRALERMFELAE